MTNTSPQSPSSPVSASAGLIALIYGAVSYLIFLATFLYAVGFIGDFAVPKSLDGAPTQPWQTALLIDLGLLSLFALQHSVMARPWFKRRLTHLISPAVERSTYVLASSLALLLLFWQWQPLGGVVWAVEHRVGQVLLHGGFAFGWGLVLITTFVINHFDLFGLRQVWRHWQGQPPSEIRFVVPLLYRMVRHPLYVGWLFAFWCAPVMTMSHLFFALVTTAYILVAIRFEERDLMQAHPEYAAYRQQVPMLVPGPPRKVVTAAALTLLALTAGPSDVHAEDRGVEPAELLKMVPPYYPNMARANRIETDIVVSAIIDSNGKPTGLKPIRGHALFTVPVMAAVSQWTYRPATLRGVPIHAPTLIRIRFRLENN